MLDLCMWFKWRGVQVSPLPSFLLPPYRAEMLFTLIQLQGLSLGVLGAVGFTHLDCLPYAFLMLRGESQSQS